MKKSFKAWVASGAPWIWLNAGAVAISVILVVGLLGLIAVRGFSHFWPADVMQAVYNDNGTMVNILGEKVEEKEVSYEQLRSAGFDLSSSQAFYTRELYKVGNRDITGADFRWVLEEQLTDVSYPKNVMVLERREWGNFYGFLVSVNQNGQHMTADTSDDLWLTFQEGIARALHIKESISVIEKGAIGSINSKMERLRLKEKRFELENKNTPENLAHIQEERALLDAHYQSLQEELTLLYTQINRDSFKASNVDGTEITLHFAQIVRAFQPNKMNILTKIVFYGEKLIEFMTDDPREANTEGGIFPAIFGTVMMVIIMAIIVMPFGVVAALYLREYAKQGLVTRIIRIAVNNLAGVPSIVYGIFGLGFFIYFLGSNIDLWFFPEALPAPTFGTPGLMWASLTLALLTLPVVIVATEEGLTRIPRALREGSLALGATKAETIWKVVIPMASPAMMTGLILAVARAAGEVAPLMLVGVVKLAPSLPVNGNYPFIHLDQKFMHLGFHIYDVGFQSPNVEAARPLVYATALLLVIVIALLNLSAVSIRNRLREKYKSLEH